MKKIPAFLIALLFSLASFAQAPQSFNYQAVVRDNSGTIIPNHAVSFKFVIHQGSASGPVAYSETQPGTTDAFGGVAFAIGAGTPVTGSFAAINWSTGVYYNEVLLDPAGGSAYQSMGAAQLLSVPYALYAQNSGTMATAHVSVSASQIQNLVTAPVTIVPAPAPGNFIQVLAANGVLHFGTVPYNYSAGSILSLQLTPGNDMFTNSSLLSSGANLVARFSDAMVEPVQDNAPLLLTTRGTNPTGGDGTLDIYVTYLVVKE